MEMSNNSLCLLRITTQSLKEQYQAKYTSCPLVLNGWQEKTRGVNQSIIRTREVEGQCRSMTLVAGWGRRTLGTTWQEQLLLHRPGPSLPCWNCANFEIKFTLAVVEKTDFSESKLRWRLKLSLSGWSELRMLQQPGAQLWRRWSALAYSRSLSSGERNDDKISI